MNVETMLSIVEAMIYLYVVFRLSIKIGSMVDEQNDMKPKSDRELAWELKSSDSGICQAFKQNILPL